jgi:hypothetical protein
LGSHQTGHGPQTCGTAQYGAGGAFYDLQGSLPQHHGALIERPGRHQPSSMLMTQPTHFDSRSSLHPLVVWVTYHNWGSSLTRPPSEQTKPSDQQAHSKVSLLVLWTPCSGVERGVFEPTIRVWRSGSTRKQPANLVVEGAEESLSSLPDCTPTVRPPPKRS